MKSDSLLLDNSYLKFSRIFPSGHIHSCVETIYNSILRSLRSRLSWTSNYIYSINHGLSIDELQVAFAKRSECADVNSRSRAFNNYALEQKQTLLVFKWKRADYRPNFKVAQLFVTRPPKLRIYNLYSQIHFRV